MSKSSLGAVREILEKQRQTYTGIALNEAAIREIDRELIDNGILSSLLDKIVLHVFQAGMTIRLRVRGREIQLNERTQQFFNSQWVPELKKAHLAGQKYGVFPIVYVPMRKRNGDTIVVPRVPMEGTWTIRFTVNEHGLPDYTLVRTHAVTNQNVGTRIAPGPWEGSRVFEVNRPAKDGKLNSVVQKVMRYVSSFNNMWKNYDQVTDELAHPPYILNTTGAVKKSSSDEPADIPLGETDAGLGEEDRTREMNENAREELQRAREVAAATNMGLTRQVYDPHSQTHQEAQVKEPWEVRKWDLPAGITIASNFPRPNVPSAFGSVTTELINIMSNIIGIPDQITTQAGRKFAASANLAQRQFNDLIKSFQEQLVGPIQTMFYDIYGNDQLRFAQDVIAIEEEARGFKFDDAELQQITEEIEVVPVFNNVPDVTFEVLRQMFQDDLIPLEEYAKQSFRLFGICEADSCLNKKGTFFSDLNISGGSGESGAGTPSEGPVGSLRAKKRDRGGGGGGGEREQRETSASSKRQRVAVQASSSLKNGHTAINGGFAPKLSNSSYYSMFDIDKSHLPLFELSDDYVSSTIPPQNGISNQLNPQNLTVVSTGITDYSALRIADDDDDEAVKDAHKLAIDEDEQIVEPPPRNGDDDGEKPPSAPKIVSLAKKLDEIDNDDSDSDSNDVPALKNDDASRQSPASDSGVEAASVEQVASDDDRDDSEKSLEEKLPDDDSRE